MVHNLDKGTVNLTKAGDAVLLARTAAPPLTRVRVGLGWDPATGGEEIDLDASVIAYGERPGMFGGGGYEVKATVYFGAKSAFGGAIRHCGDNLTGHGDGDDECIDVDLSALPAEVAALAVVVNSYSGHPFAAVRSAHCRLLDAATDAELVRIDLSASTAVEGAGTGLVMATLRRGGGPGAAWEMHRVGSFHGGRTAHDMIGAGAGALR